MVQQRFAKPFTGEIWFVGSSLMPSSKKANMNSNQITVSVSEYRELLRQAMTLESTLDNLIRNNYRNIPALTIESMRDEASNAVRTASKRLERLHKKEKKDKK